jgi:spore coat protein H
MNTVEDAKSYWIHDAVTDRWTYGPWDFNNTDAKYQVGNKAGKHADYDHPLFNFSLFDGWVEEEWLDREEDQPGRFKPIFSNLNTRIVNHPQLRARLLALYEKGIAELLEPAVLAPRIDAMHALLAPHMRGAPHVEQALFADSPRYLKEYSANRTLFLRNEIASWRARKPQLVIQAVNAQQGWVELRNLHTSAVSTTGLVLTTNLRTAKKKNLPAKTLVPGETVRFTAKQLGLKMTEDGELGLFNGKSVVGVLDLLFYGKLPSGRYYERSQDAPNPWEIH